MKFNWSERTLWWTCLGGDVCTPTTFLGWLFMKMDGQHMGVYVWFFKHPFWVGLLGHNGNQPYTGVPLSLTHTHTLP